MKYGTITFPAGKIKFDILDTPVTRKWLTALSKWNDTDYKLAVSTGTVFHEAANVTRSQGIIDLEQKYVDRINAAIDRFNFLTEGFKIQYRAYVDMPWKQTNLIHRCFTLGSSSISLNKDHSSLRCTGIIHHHLTATQLREYKDRSKDDGYWVPKVTSPQFYFNRSDYNKVWTALNEINKFVHLYEGIRFSKNSAKSYEGAKPWFKNLKSSVEVPNDINFFWDCFTDTGGKSFFYSERPTNEEVKASIPPDWYDYDIFVVKSIKGKDYETTYANMDDPMEYDIQNLQDVTGGVRMFVNDSHKYLYRDSHYAKWLEDSGLEPHHYLPIPVGKIVDMDFPLADIKCSGEMLNSDDSYAATPPYRYPTIKVSDVPHTIKNGKLFSKKALI